MIDENRKNYRVFTDPANKDLNKCHYARRSEIKQ